MDHSGLKKHTLAKTMHFILEVEDDGLPSLTRYQRVIISVLPKI